MTNEVSVQIGGMSHRNSEGHSATLPFLLGFVIGMVLPLVSLMVFPKLAEETVVRCGANTIVIRNSVMVVWMYLSSALSVVIAYMSYCYFRVREKEAASDVAKTELEFANNALREVCRNDKEMRIGVSNKEKRFTVRVDGNGSASSSCSVTMTQHDFEPKSVVSSDI